MSLATDEEPIRLLVEDAAVRLDPLLADVKEYVRKQDWHYRSEARPAREQAAWVRSVAFVVGEAPRWERDQVHWLREKAQNERRIRPGGQGESRP